MTLRSPSIRMLSSGPDDTRASRALTGADIVIGGRTPLEERTTKPAARLALHAPSGALYSAAVIAGVKWPHQSEAPTTGQRP